MRYLKSILTSQPWPFTAPNVFFTAALIVCFPAPLIAASSGEEVESISGIETLTHWTTLDTRRLTLRVNHAERYLLTLDDHCEHLRGAQLVGVSMTNQEIWADFDHVAADGHECRIDRITRLKSN